MQCVHCTNAKHMLFLCIGATWKPKFELETLKPTYEYYSILNLTFQGLVPGKKCKQNIRVVGWWGVVEVVQQPRGRRGCPLVHGSTHLCRAPPPWVSEYPESWSILGYPKCPDTFTVSTNNHSLPGSRCTVGYLFKPWMSEESVRPLSLITASRLFWDLYNFTVFRLVMFKYNRSKINTFNHQLTPLCYYNLNVDLRGG